LKTFNLDQQWIFRTPNGWEEFEYWMNNDPDIVAKELKDLIKSIRQRS
jgi:Txe/YoeB family toxin of Txe-Axe toxin-antitoxin module